MGVALQEHGKLNDAIEHTIKALSSSLIMLRPTTIWAMPS